MLQAENAYGLQKRVAFCAQVIDELRPREVLDIGCGTGTNLTRPLAERFPRVRFLGIDSDAASIRYARAAHSLPNLAFEKDFQHTAVPAAFDLIVASEVVEHVDDPDGFLAELRARLPEHGRMIVTLPNGFGPFEAASLIEVLLRLSGAFDLLRRAKRSVAPGNAPSNETLADSLETLSTSPHVNFFSYRDVQALFERVGLTVERYRARTFVCGFGLDYMVRRPAMVAWNARVADRLPKSCVSDWMFVLSPSAAHRGSSYSRSAYARWRRRLNERWWRVAPVHDSLR